MKKGVNQIIVSIVLFVLAVVFPLAAVVPLFFQKDMATFRASAPVELSIDKPGRYYVWDNINGVYDGQTYSFEAKLPTGISFTLIERNSGFRVPMASGLSVSSRSGTQEKASVGYFEIIKPGKYVLSIEGNTGRRIFSVSRNP